MKIVIVGNHSVDYSTETHYARTLESLGHTVDKLQENVATGEDVESAARQADLLVISHSHGWGTPGKPISEVLTSITTPSVSYHLDIWMGLARERDLYDDPFYSLVDHFFTVDNNMAEHMNRRDLHARYHYLPAGVVADECFISPEGGKQWDVIFVGSRGYHPEWPYRPQLLDWLQATFGDRFAHYGGDGLGVVRGVSLNRLYANTKVVVGDSLNLGFHYPDYWSDRVYETLGRGGFLIHPFVEGLQREFILGEHLRTYNYGDFDGLEQLIRHYLVTDEEREAIRQAGHEYVKGNYTYTHRWRDILRIIQ